MAKHDAFRNALHGCRAVRGVRAQVDGGDAAQKLSRALAYAPFSLAPSARCASCKMQQRRYIVSDGGTAPEALLAEKRPRVLQLQSRMEVSRRLFTQLHLLKPWPAYAPIAENPLQLVKSEVLDYLDA